MDKSVKPGDDFWAYVNGTWDKNTQIAADRASAGPVRDARRTSPRRTSARSSSISPTNPNRDQLGQQIGDYYASFVDTAAIEAAGTAPLKPYLAEIDAAKTRAQLLSLFIKPGFASPVDVASVPTSRTRTLRGVRRPGALGLPSREYYLDDKAKMKAHRAAYRDYIIDDPEARRTARRRSARGPHHRARDRSIEGAVAGCRPPRHRQDLQPDDPAQLTKLAPQFDWDATLAKAGLGNAKRSS